MQLCHIPLRRNARLYRPYVVTRSLLGRAAAGGGVGVDAAGRTVQVWGRQVCGTNLLIRPRHLHLSWESQVSRPSFTHCRLFSPAAPIDGGHFRSFSGTASASGSRRLVSPATRPIYAPSPRGTHLSVLCYDAGVFIAGLSSVAAPQGDNDLVQDQHRPLEEGPPPPPSITTPTGHVALPGHSMGPEVTFCAPVNKHFASTSN